MPPKDTTSTPTSVVNARSGTPSVAAALAIRAPSRWTTMPRSCACSVIAAISSDGVAGAELGALGDRDDLGLGAVLVAVPPRLQVDQLGGELAVRGGHGEQLQPTHLLRRAALVDVDVRGLGADHRLPPVGHRLQRDDVGAGPVEDGVRRRAAAEVRAEQVLQPRGVDVRAVADLVPAVGGGDRRRAPRGGCRRSCRWRNRGPRGRAAACGGQSVSDKSASVQLGGRGQPQVERWCRPGRRRRCSR